MSIHAAWWLTTNCLGLRDRALDHVDGDRLAGVRSVNGNQSAVAYVAFPSTGRPPGPFGSCASKRPGWARKYRG